MKESEKVIEWIKQYFKDNGKDCNAIIGISGGCDSSVTAALLVKALGKDRVIGVLMPNGNQYDIDCSYQLVKFLDIKYYVININKPYLELTNEIDTKLKIDSKSYDIYRTNTPSRLRMATLYGISGLLNGRVANTCNLSESIVGWETYGGDGFGDFAPIGKLTKTEVVELGDYMKLPQELVHKAPSDGMCGATDEDKLGFTYETLDTYIRESLRPKARETFDRIMLLHKKSHFKHENIRIPTCNIDAPICEDFDWN